MKKIILTIFCLGMLFPLLGSAARPYGVEEIPNVQVGNRYRFTSNPDGVLSPSAVAEIDSLCYSLRHRALAQVAVVYEGENETYIEASAENSGSTLYDKEIRDKPRTRHTKRNV